MSAPENTNFLEIFFLPSVLSHESLVYQVSSFPNPLQKFSLSSYLVRFGRANLKSDILKSRTT